MSDPLISVIINNYNYAAFLTRAIESALDQEGVSAEVIVVDDGSSDDSRAVIDGFGSKVVSVFQVNGGQAAAINAGVRRSRGQILCFLDADDWCAPGKLTAIAAAFAANPKAGLVFHRLQPVLSDGRNAFGPIPRSICDGDLSRLMARSAGRWPFPMTSAVSVRRAHWDQIGDIPESFRISADAWLVGMYPFVSPVVGLPQVLGFYRIHANNWYRAVDDAAMLQKRMAHWQATLTATNRFLSTHRPDLRVSLEAHLPYQTAHARLHGANPATRLRLLLKGFGDQAEPNLARRIRDALRSAVQISGKGMIEPSILRAQ